MENDDGKRPSKGIVVTLLDLEDGTSRIIMDDVGSDDLTRDTSWKHECFYTHKRLPSKEIGDMALDDRDYQGIGESLMARLVALTRRVP